METAEKARMTTISSSESSLLALVAENPDIPAGELAQLLATAGPEVKALAEAIVEVAHGGPDASHDHPLHAAAKSMLEWARANRAQRKVRVSAAG